MCVIAICEVGQELDKKTFESCFEHNDHGAGFAWLQDGLVGYAKGYMSVKSAWKAYKTIKKYAHIAHFRLNSSGGVCKELTHPFLVKPDSPISMKGIGEDAVLFHNGTVANYESTLMSIAISNKAYPEGKVSDSRVMAMAVALVGDRVLEVGYSKYVIMAKDGVTYYGNWEKKNDILFSNLYWERSKSIELSSYKVYKDRWITGKDGVIIKNTELPLELKGSGIVKDKEEQARRDRLANAELEEKYITPYNGAYYGY